MPLKKIKEKTRIAIVKIIFKFYIVIASIIYLYYCYKIYYYL